ncbi:caspase family protein [Streptomyces coerulescens]|uniref:Caspase family protein n=1 Tax=Streptomyces coerulescens TaxID=29304 RepID=A0ABW0CGZ1_STRCD
MTRYRALLIGVAQYTAPGISALPFVLGDMERMAAALSERGFHSPRLASSPWFTPNVINGEVTGFLAEAEPGDRLLIVLSGHGVHSEGKDYLVPEDIRPELSTFTSGCVEIDWREELERCRAAQIVFLIDACREGIQRDSMGTSAWTNRKVAATLRRKVAYVYACSKAEVARYVRDTDTVRDVQEASTQPRESFSLFSRTVTELLGSTVSSLREFRQAAQERITALHEAYGKPGAAQHIRVLTEDDHDGFVIFPPVEEGARAVGAEQAWADAVLCHPVWRRTDPARGASVEALREFCAWLVGAYGRACGEAERALAEDPWYDRELAERTTERLGFLLVHLPENTPLSPTEAALLAVLPFASQTHWAQHAAQCEVSEEALSDFLHTLPRLHRRLRTLEQDPNRAVQDICWWGFHRWLVLHPEAFTTRFLTCSEPLGPAHVVDWAREELSAERLLGHLKEQRIAPVATPGTTRSTALADERPVAPSTEHEHDVRERLVSCLFKAAHALAIDSVDLPEVLVEHIGISDSVSLEALHGTLRRARWLPTGGGRSLNALCEHPAVELALRRHADAVDTLLRDIDKEAAKRGSSLAALRSLPTYADAQQVSLSTATPAELTSGIRFRLADDRVQELLMGEQLYGNRELAIRELYQNALDALRYRAARTEYLQRTGVQVPEWKGEIIFTEGKDDRGRPYLQCADNGIGMGVTELSRSFSQGGSRYVDLPEYLEEEALWASLDPPLEFWPVSRFGLGVLSYFMIADELTISTCRLDRKGRPGQRLKVTIAGPGNLFRVEDLGPGAEAGTTVRLHGVRGQKIPSSGTELGQYLRVSQYRVQAPRKGKIRVWEPGALVTAKRSSAEASRPQQQPVPDREPEDRQHPELSHRPFVWTREKALHAHGDTLSRPCPEPSMHDAPVAAEKYGVWWVNGESFLLVDGISSGQRKLFGRAVDLHGTEQVTLSIDRKKILNFDSGAVHRRCLAAVDDLVDHACFLTPPWLGRLQQEDGALADAIVARAADKGVCWRLGDWTLNVARAGFFPPDHVLLPAVTGTLPRPRTHHDVVAALLVLCMPEPVIRWRLLALHPDLSADSVPVAMPSDMQLLLPDAHSTSDTWETYLAEANRNFAMACDGHSRSVHPPSTYYERQGDDRPAELLQLIALPSWRSAQQPVPPEEVLSIALEMECAPSHVAERLARLDYDVVPLGPLSEATAEDLPLLCLNWQNDYRSGVLPIPPGGYVPLAHLYRQGHPAEAARRLEELGYTIPEQASDGLVAADEIDSVDQSILFGLIMYYGHSGLPNSPAEETSVDAEGIRFSNVPPKVVARRLTRLGFPVSSHPSRGGVTASFGQLTVSPGSLSFKGFSRTEAEFGWHRPQLSPSAAASLTATHLRVAATLTCGSVDTLKAELAKLGHPHNFAEDLAHDQVLIHAFEEPASLPHPNCAGGGRITLAEIASAAIMVHRPFREVAAKATELGFRHDAEQWFTDAR